MNVKGNPGVGGRPFQGLGGVLGLLGSNEVFGLANREMRRVVGSGLLGRGGFELALRVLWELRLRPPLYGHVGLGINGRRVGRVRVVGG